MRRPRLGALRTRAAIGLHRVVMIMRGMRDVDGGACCVMTCASAHQGEGVVSARRGFNGVSL